MNDRKHVVVGLFVLGGFVLLGILIIWFEGVSHLVRGGYVVRGHLPSAKGVRAGKRVHLDGIEIGDVTDINPDAVVTDPLINEYTFVMRAGSLTGADTTWTPLGDIATYEFNAGDGTFHIYEDVVATGTNRDWGTYPPNTTAPASFEDGILILGATFTNLSITVRLSDWTANLNGTLSFYCGEEWGSLPCYEGWTFAGQTIEPGQPDGYMWTIDGQVYVEEVSTEQTSWGELKGLFR